MKEGGKDEGERSKEKRKKAVKRKSMGRVVKKEGRQGCGAARNLSHR